MGIRLASRKLELDALISSPANRALATARLIADQLDFPKSDIIENNDVYHAGYSTLVKIIQDFPVDFKSVMLVGHNPGFTDLCNFIKEPDYHISNIPTCGVVAVEFALNQWSEISKHSGRLLFFDYPKKVL
ncbi:MAG: hypothetical protein DHS20C17_13460 [Cyclobacteriaceae bacterium]|nr:MAG: hypothetical protein DHS20C17_13460 [Cyclobacteriaceae bacterium]